MVKSDCREWGEKSVGDCEGLKKERQKLVGMVFTGGQDLVADRDLYICLTRAAISADLQRSGWSL